MRELQRDRLMTRVNQAFLDHGYDNLTMIGLAKACDLTRRALYHHFDNKEDAFREAVRWGNVRNIANGIAAANKVLTDGGDAVDALAILMDVRYGETRRNLAKSPHANEINYEAFRRCRAVMIEQAVIFHERLAAFLAELVELGLLSVRPDIALSDLSRFLADGARGVNQSLPPPLDGELPMRYRQMCDAILHGCAVSVANANRDWLAQSASIKKH